MTTVLKEATPLVDGVQGETCTVCGQTNASGVIPATKSLKILTIGNSYSCDSNRFLYDMLKEAFIEAGITPVSYDSSIWRPESELNLVTDVYWRNGATIDNHYDAAINKNYANFRYRTDVRGDLSYNADDSFLSTITLDYALANHDWDYIILQQYRAATGDNYYEKTEAVIDYIKEKCPNAKILLNMPWTSNITCTDDATAQFGSLSAMFENSVDVAKETLDKGLVSDVVPAGTAIRNNLGFMDYDDLYRDAVHLNANGRTIAALTWFSYFTGLSPEIVSLPTSDNKTDYSDTAKENEEYVVDIGNDAELMNKIYTAIKGAINDKFVSTNSNVDTLVLPTE